MPLTPRIYLDNSATSFPKPEVVAQAMGHYATALGASPGRGAYAEARRAGELLFRCRQRLQTLIGGERPEHVIFTLNASDALNLAIHGLVRPGDHVVTSWMEHNSVLRPLNRLVSTLGVEQTRVRCDPVTGLIDPEDVRRALRPSTRLVALVHGSNVTGTLQPIRDVGRIAREREIPFLVDAAQTIGHVPLDVQDDFIDLLAFPGHKGLLGPLGTGALYIRPGIERLMTTVREGGTGSVSNEDTQPSFLPDRFEPGSHNAIGLIGLDAAVGWVLDRTVEELWGHQRELMTHFLEGLDGAPGVKIYGPPTAANRCGVFSVRVAGFPDPQVLSDRLEQRFGILSRSGIHCAPLAHQTIGTSDLGGTTRLSFGPFTARADVEQATTALRDLAASKANDDAA